MDTVSCCTRQDIFANITHTTVAMQKLSYATLRVQCEVSSVPSGRQACLLLTSKSKHNPTGVQLGIHRADHKRVVKLLNEGKWQQLACGTTGRWC